MVVKDLVWVLTGSTICRDQQWNVLMNEGETDEIFKYLAVDYWCVFEFHQIFSLSKSNTVMIQERKYFHKWAGEGEQPSMDQTDIPWILGCINKQTMKLLHTLIQINTESSQAFGTKLFIYTQWTQCDAQTLNITYKNIYSSSVLFKWRCSADH
jgi:hypothetical protein